MKKYFGILVLLMMSVACNNPMTLNKFVIGKWAYEDEKLVIDKSTMTSIRPDYMTSGTPSITIKYHYKIDAQNNTITYWTKDYQETTKILWDPNIKNTLQFEGGDIIFYRQ